MNFPEIIIIFLFGLSLTANLCYVLFNERMGKYTYRWDLFRWISSYQLFSISPRNFTLYFRDRFEDGTKAEWQELQVTSDPRWYHSIVFPEKLVSDCIYSYIDDLVRFSEAGHKSIQIIGSFHYRTVFDFVNLAPANTGVSARQFKIEETGGHAGKVQGQVFLSEFNEWKSV